MQFESVYNHPLGPEIVFRVLDLTWAEHNHSCKNPEDITINGVLYPKGTLLCCWWVRKDEYLVEYRDRWLAYPEYWSMPDLYDLADLVKECCDVPI